MLKRIALVIGNSDYSIIGRLKNPANDARALSDFLQQNGFRLVGDKPLLNATRSQIEQAADVFARNLDRDTVGLLYFSGHGLQLGGANYLCPVEAGGAKETHVEAELVSVARILKRIEEAQAALNIIILDACRNDPFQGRSFQSRSGFAPMQASTGTILSFATQPGQIASDGAGKNSPFALGLIAGLGEPGIDALAAFNNVGLHVKEATGGQQVPWMASSPISGRFFFVEAAKAVAEPPPQQGAPSWWEEIEVEDPGAAKDAGDASLTLPERIEKAADGDSILLEPGTYDGNLTLTRSIRLAAKEAGSVVLSGAMRIEGAKVTLEGLSFDVPSGSNGIFIDEGEATLVGCALQTEFDRQSAATTSGIIVTGASGRLDMRGGRIEGFPEGVWFEREARGRISRNVEIAGMRDVRDVGEATTVGVMVRSGCEVDLTRGITIADFQRAVSVIGPSTMTISDATIQVCAYAIANSGQGARSTVSETRMEDVEYGLGAWEGGEIKAQATSIDASAMGVCAVGEGSRIEVEGCPHIAATHDNARGIYACDKAQVIVTDSKFFGGNCCVHATTGGGVAMIASELYDVKGSCVFIDEGSSAALHDCDIHRAAYMGIACEGSGSATGCLIHHNDKTGIKVHKTGRFEISDCKVYQNDVGIAAHDEAVATISAGLIASNSTYGILAFDRSRIGINLSAVRQNREEGVVSSDNSEIECKFSSVAHNGGPPFVKAGKSRFIDTGNETGFRSCPSDYGTGGRTNAINNQDYFLAPVSRVLDELQARILSGPLRDWSRQAARTSEDGRTVTYVLTRSMYVNVRLKPISAGGGLIETFSGNLRTTRSLRYDRRIEISVSRTDLVPDFHKVEVQIAEHEDIDQDYQSRLNIGQQFSAPSLLCDEQIGCNLLKELGQKLLPPKR